MIKRQPLPLERYNNRNDDGGCGEKLVGGEQNFLTPQASTAAGPRLPPTAPPPSYPNSEHPGGPTRGPPGQYPMINPPPSYSFAHHIYDALEPKSQHKWMCYLAVSELVLGAIAFSIAVTCASLRALQFFFPLFVGCWTTPFYLINAVLGIIAAKKGTANFFVAHLIFSVLSIVFSVILITFCILNWLNAGYSSREVDCVIFKHDHPKFARLNADKPKIDFDYCVLTFKLATSFLVTLVILAIVLGVLNVISMALCIVRTGSCSRRFRRFSR